MMPYTADSPLRRTMSRDEVDLDALERWFLDQGAARPGDLNQYLGVLLAGCLHLKLDYWLALGQFDLETDTGRSEPWRTGCNPGGLGMTRPGGYPANPNAQRWTNGSEAAFAHLAHLTAYVYGNDWPDVWHERWPDPYEIDKRFGIAVYTYGGMGQTLFALNMTWAIDPQNNYHGKLVARANLLASIARKDSEPVAELIFGRVPHPPYTRSIIRKDPGHGYTASSVPRKIKGVVHHEWMDSGPASESFYTGFFACPYGERHAAAMTDYYIMRNGKIVMLNDPEGYRIPWASGGSGPYEGDGGPFVRKFGSAAVNRDLVSWEYAKRDGENYTPEQIQSGGALAAHWHDRDGQRWDEHPYTSKYGLVTSFLHYELGSTSCGRGELDDITKVQAVTRGTMRKYQEGTDDTPIPPDVPPLPEPPLPGGVTLEEATARFGKIRRFKDGAWSAAQYGFDPDGPISTAWITRAAEENEWPAGNEWWVIPDGDEMRQLVTFSNNWVLLNRATRAQWEWL